MKYGKSISVEELFEPVLCALRCRWRLKQALLLLSLQTGQVAYWQNGEHSWQEQLDGSMMLATLPAMTADDMTVFSRTPSIAGLVTWAKFSLK